MRVRVQEQQLSLLLHFLKVNKPGYENSKPAILQVHQVRDVCGGFLKLWKEESCSKKWKTSRSSQRHAIPLI